MCKAIASHSRGADTCLFSRRTLVASIMLTNKNTTSQARRSWLRLQFSLRLLLIAFTCFAIGFPVWYRLPFKEITRESPAGSANEVQRVTTWQRQWGGGRLKHGLERLVVNGTTTESTTFQNGLRHGPYVSRDLRGQYVDDLKEGSWTAPDRTSTWHRGKLHGPYEIRLSPIVPRKRLPGKEAPPIAGPAPAMPQMPRVYKLEFADGRLTQFEGKPAANRLFDLMEEDKVDRRTERELRRFTSIDVVEMPLSDIAMYLSEVHGIPMVLDPGLLATDTPITGEYRGIDLCSALTLLTAPYDLGCDYRYGCIWITNAEDSADWHDPTGVADIKPPSSSALGRAWNEPAVVDVVGTPLASALDYLEELLAIEIDSSAIRSPDKERLLFPVTANMRGIPFHHVLGQLLYKTDCRCRLAGDGLVIESPKSN